MALSLDDYFLINLNANWRENSYGARQGNTRLSAAAAAVS